MAAFDPFQGVYLLEQIVATQKRFLIAKNNKTNKVSFYPNTITTPIIFNAIK
jgi:hypothetical protein